jgi:hypothetical protein
MRPISVLLLLAAVPMIAFGYWGVYTYAGRQKYDEMAGILPSAALDLGIFLLLIVLIITLVDLIKKRKRNKIK